MRIGAGNMGQETEMVLTVEGSFASAGEPGDKAHLVEMAKTVMRKMFDEGKHKLEQNVPYYTKPCQQTKNGCIRKFIPTRTSIFSTPAMVIESRD